MSQKLREVPIEECGGRYWASYFGDIYMLSSSRVHGKNAKIGWDGKILVKLEPKPNRRGYKAIKVGKLGEKQRKQIGVHTMVATAWLGIPKAGQEVDHIDRNPSNNCVDNLRWVTHKENMRNRNDHRATRKVKCWDTGEVFNSVTEVFEKFKKPEQKSRQGLYECLAGRSKSWHGRTFVYLEEEE